MIYTWRFVVTRDPNFFNRKLKKIGNQGLHAAPWRQYHRLMPDASKARWPRTPATNTWIKIFVFVLMTDCNTYTMPAITIPTTRASNKTGYAIHLPKIKRRHLASKNIRNHQRGSQRVGTNILGAFGKSVECKHEFRAPCLGRWVKRRWIGASRS